MDRRELDDFITLHEKEIFEHNEPERKWSELTLEEKKKPSSFEFSVSLRSPEEIDEFMENLRKES